MSDQIITADHVEQTDSDDIIEWADAAELGVGHRSMHAVRRAWQRGMATAEYAVGVLAAVALALVLLRIFTHNDFFATLLKFVVGLIGKVSGMLP